MCPRLRDPFVAGQPRLEARERKLLCIGECRHELQVSGDGVTDRILPGELAQPLCARRKDAASIRQAKPRNRALRESLNPAAFENS